ncbi:MAG: threonylcarbamoyl-AMP synthase [Firmicutes bacterium]|nr:threonylcarbamoyl-AMP synthase [Bacillota bacterium]
MCATCCYKVEPGDPNPLFLEEAGRVLRAGGTVAFPTETVYGLGADATNPAAISRIFAAKGRPLDNPLIVHIADWHQIDMLTLKAPPALYELGRRFWPGPLTLVVPRHPDVPPEVSAGLPTVAVRWPAHPVAEALIRAAGVPLAAPSANRSGKPSPTNAEHVKQDLEGMIDVILDGGPTGVGVESTVLDLTRTPPMILRPGGVTREMLEEVLGPVDTAAGLENETDPPPSPGMKYRHYAPDSPLVLLEGEPREMVEQARRVLGRVHAEGRRAGLLGSREMLEELPSGDGGPDFRCSLGSREDLEQVAANLYQALRLTDEMRLDLVLVESFPERGIGAAIMNRLRRAAFR